MTIALRPNWHNNFGSGSFTMPVDPVWPTMNWNGPFPQTTEDSQTGFDADHMALGNIGDVGGPGICMGYSVQDPENVVMMSDAMHARPELYDGPTWEHWIRKVRWDIARTCMIRDTVGPRRVLGYANIARLQWSEQGEVSWDPGWRPMNIHQYHEEALRNPHQALYINIRAVGWVAYVEAMACKIDINRSRAWLQMFLSTCEMAAIPGTGQIGIGPNTGGGPTVPVNVQYSFHWGICAHAAICAARVLHQMTPIWVIEGMEAMDACASEDGVLQSFLYSEGGILNSATGPGQHPDPAYGWWTTNCAALAQAYDPSWKARALKWFAPTGVPEQDRKFTMLYRGIQ